MSQKKILIVDDEEHFCILLKMNLELSGDFTVDIVTDSRKAVETVVETKPDLILLDILMPGVNGLEILKKIKESEGFSATPVVMLSAKDDAESRDKAKELHSDGYLVKPIGVADLKAKIEEVIKGAEKKNG